MQPVFTHRPSETDIAQSAAARRPSSLTHRIAVKLVRSHDSESKPAATRADIHHSALGVFWKRLDMSEDSTRDRTVDRSLRWGEGRGQATSDAWRGFWSELLGLL